MNAREPKTWRQLQEEESARLHQEWLDSEEYRMLVQSENDAGNRLLMFLLGFAGALVLLGALAVASFKALLG